MTINKIKDKYPLIIITAFALIYFVSYKIYQYCSYHGLGSEFVYYFEQTFWNTAHGNFMITGRGASFFSEHFPLIIIFIYPIYYIFQSPYTLIVIHSAICALAVIPLYMLASHFFKNKTVPVVFSIAYVISKLVFNGLQYEIHMEIFYPILFFTVFYFLVKEKWLYYYIFLILALSVKEDASIAAIGLGIYVFIKYNKKHGIFTSCIAFIWLVLTLGIIIPHFRTGSYQFFSYWSSYGSTAGEIAINMFNPLKQFEVIFTGVKINYMFNILILFAFLPCATLSGFIFLAAPYLFLLFSSNNSHMYGYFQYYGLLAAPFLFFSSLAGLKTIYDKRSKNSNRIFYAGLFLILLANVVLNIKFFGELVNVISWDIPVRYKTADELMKLIPENASVEAQENLLAHIPPREKRILFPGGKGLDYILIDREGVKYPLNDESYPLEIENLKKDTNYTVIQDKDGFILFKKIK